MSKFGFSYSSATIYSTASGKVAVPQHVHYCYRGPKLVDYTLHEWVAIVDVIPKKKRKTKPNSNVQVDDEDQDLQDPPFEEVPQRGRPTNSCVDFAKGHPLYETHTQRLRSKIKVPVPRHVPRPPPEKPRKLTDPWKKQAREFAQFYLTFFKPWRQEIEGNPVIKNNKYSYSKCKSALTGGGTLPVSLKWKSFCQHIRELEDGCDGLGPSFLDEVRTRWIRSMAYGMRTTNRNRAAVQEFRGRVRKLWGVPESPQTAMNPFNNHAEEETIEEDDLQAIQLAEIAQFNIALLQEEADDISNVNPEVDRYLEKTKSSLERLIENARTATEFHNIRLNSDDGIPIVHQHAEMGELIEDVIEKLKPNAQNSEEIDDFNDILNEIPTRRNDNRITDNPSVDPTLLNRCQKVVYNHIKSYLLNKHDAQQRQTEAPNPFQYLIHGGPGIQIKLENLKSNSLFFLQFRYRKVLYCTMYSQISN